MAALEGRRIVVSGAAGGIGRALCERLRREGAEVFGFDRNPGTTGEVEVLDVCDADAVARALAERAPFDGLVAAHGVTRDAVCWKLDPEDWRAVLDVNLTGCFHLARAAVPVLRTRGGGAIVLLGSINGRRGKFGQTAYAASKAGLVGFARSLAREGAAFGVRVNVVEPGFVDTPMTESLPPEVRERARSEILLGRLGRPDDVAGAVAWLLSPDSAWITGEVLRVDGGQALGC